MSVQYVAIIASLLFLLPVARDTNLPAQQPETINLYTSSATMDLAPVSPFTAEISASLTNLAPRIGIEVTLPIPVQAQVFSDGGIAQVVEILQRVQTMEGIEYWSASRETMRVLYRQSYRIASPSDRVRQADIAIMPQGEETRITVFQEDGTFGENVYLFTYNYQENTVFLTMENASTMTYRFIPMVRPHNLRTYILVQFHEELQELRFYGNIAVRVPTILGMENRARDSFTNRIVAIQNWFVDQLAAEGLLR